MAIKKSELYSKLWQSCDELRGGMDASQYKDYVLVLLFVKYVSDKATNDSNALVEVPLNSSFSDMIKLKNKNDIGDKINKQIIAPIAQANELDNLRKIDFDDETKLGKGKDRIDRLTKLIGIFQNLDFSKNQADGDDILGDAYEYLMRHFATESGKSKGQFYTPSEVSQVMAKVIGIENVTSSNQTIYDPTCGSGSLLLKAAEEAPLKDGKKIKMTIYGQEMDNTTAGLAKMNMFIHNNETALIHGSDSTISTPFFKDAKNDRKLKTFDFVVANPPFSIKSWRNGFKPEDDEYERFEDGIPPTKNGDYAFLLHIIKSLNSLTGKGAVILPHGVLFRGNAEADIRKNLINKGYIKCIIGLPANLFYGTGIPACIIVLDKENAQTRKGIFMVDASRGFFKDGNKNRLRHQDIHKIVEVVNKQLVIDKYSRMVLKSEIVKNEYNLNIPRYVDTQEEEDIQDIEAHLLGGIPKKDVNVLSDYWSILPNLKNELFSNHKRDNYYDIKIKSDEVKDLILSCEEFVAYKKQVEDVFMKWKIKYTKELKNLKEGFRAKDIIKSLSDDLLSLFSSVKLIDKYDMYQHLLSYWTDVMQDDLYIISIDGFKAEVYRVFKEDKKKKTKKVVGWACDLVPKDLVINRYFEFEKNQILELETNKESVLSEITSLAEENSGEDGLLEEVKTDKGSISKSNIQKRIKLISKSDNDNKDELEVLKKYLTLLDKETDLKNKIKLLESELDKKLLQKYSDLSREKDDNEIKTLVVDDKWMTKIHNAVSDELDNISQTLTQRIKDLVKRYENTLPQLESFSHELEKTVKGHLDKMGFKY